MSFRRGPPDWLVAFLPWFGDRRARQAWREWFVDTRVVDYITAVTGGKVLETMIVMAAPAVNLAGHLLWTEPVTLLSEPTVLAGAIAWESAGELWLYAVTTFLCFIGSVFRYHLANSVETVKDTAEDVAESVEDAAEDVAESVTDN